MNGNVKTKKKTRMGIKKGYSMMDRGGRGEDNKKWIYLENKMDSE